jgi:homeobox-leucine zipper protein
MHSAHEKVIFIIFQDGLGLSRTLDLASTLEVGTDASRETGAVMMNSNLRSVLTIAFQFAYEAHTREACASMARRYVRTVVASVQRVAMALAPSHLPANLGGTQLPPGSPDTVILAHRILQSYRLHLGMELTSSEPGDDEGLFKAFWHHSDAILCCAWKQGLPEFTFGNQAGLEMLETTSGALQDLAWEKTLDENGRKTAYTDFTQVLQQVSWKVMT